MSTALGVETDTVKSFGHCDINCVGHCNARCACCSHFSPFTKPWFMSVEAMVRDLTALKPFIHFEQVCLVGGEPTLHPKLPEFIRAAYTTGIANEVMVITNGRLLPKLPEDFWKAMSETPSTLRLSIYGNLDHSIITFTEKQCAERNIRFEPIEYPDFFKQLKAVPDDGVKTWNECHWRTNCFTVHDGAFYVCPQSVFMPNLFPSLTAGEDGLALAGLTEEKLEAFLNRATPLRACSHCNGGHSETIPWREAKSKSEWSELSTV